MSAYCLFDVREVVDAQKLQEYRQRVAATVEQWGGRYLCVGARCEVVEGEWQPRYPVLIEFPSLAHAHRWYNSEEYLELKALRLAATRGDAVFFDGTGFPFV